MVFSYCICMVFFFVFFFQAEDGIRDGRVTGVQTCALPIYRAFCNTLLPPLTVRGGWGSYTDRMTGMTIGFLLVRWKRKRETRSEERRVGKEWRARGAGEH